MLGCGNIERGWRVPAQPSPLNPMNAPIPLTPITSSAEPVAQPQQRIREIPYNYTSFSDREIVLRLLGPRCWAGAPARQTPPRISDHPPPFPSLVIFAGAGGPGGGGSSPHGGGGAPP